MKKKCVFDAHKTDNHERYMRKNGHGCGDDHHASGMWIKDGYNKTAFFSFLDLCAGCIT
jgi:hypothetical protein